VELFVNPLSRTDKGTAFKLLLPFLASTEVLRMPLHGSVRQRLAKMAPASVILSWLADLGLLRGETPCLILIDPCGNPSTQRFSMN
jgi:hypothetical protein